MEPNNSILKEAYEIMFHASADGKADWELADELLREWDVRSLGSDLARKVIFQAVNHVQYPSYEVTRSIVHRAEQFATELFPELNMDEPHMADLERIEYSEIQRNEDCEGGMHPKLK